MFKDETCIIIHFYNLENLQQVIAVYVLKSILFNHLVALQMLPWLYVEPSLRFLVFYVAMLTHFEFPPNQTIFSHRVPGSDQCTYIANKIKFYFLLKL